MTQTHGAALAAAARLAGFAPPIHNSQPWRWRLDGSAPEPRAERDRQLPVTDPSGRMLTISCGAAMCYVRLVVIGRVDVTPDATGLLPAARIRHTDRRPVADVQVDPASRPRFKPSTNRTGARMQRPARL